MTDSGNKSIDINGKLFYKDEKEIYSVSEITEYISNLMSNDNLLQNINITGEVSNFHHHNSGHMYFTLKDKASCLNAVMFKSRNKYLEFEVEDGLQVNIMGFISVYKPRGIYQLYVNKMEVAGKGSLYLAYEQLKEKLSKEGLFDQDNKKEIPVLPDKIGIITSATGAAIRDILSVVKRRFENVSVLIYPSLVQGDRASEEIISGIKYLDSREDIDLIIVSRGGGSIEDLWAFNKEEVARSIYNTVKPVISGIGHETDFTIADFTADLRAPTPSAAAELAIASRFELKKSLDSLNTRLINAVENKYDNSREKFKNISKSKIFKNPEELLTGKIQQLDELAYKLKYCQDKYMSKYHETFNILSARLDSLSPLKTLSRGYSITKKDDEIIENVEMVDENDKIVTLLKNGKVISCVQKKKVIKVLDEQSGMNDMKDRKGNNNV